MTGLAGCGGDRDDDAEPTATAVPSPDDVSGGGASPAAGLPPPATPAVSPTGEIVWATAVDPTTNAPMEPVERFPADAPTLYAVLAVEPLPVGTVLSATWAYNGVPMDRLATDVVVATAGETTTWVAFHIDLDGSELWPTGTYAVSIAVAGRTRQSATVEVA